MYKQIWNHFQLHVLKKWVSPPDHDRVKVPTEQLKRYSFGFPHSSYWTPADFEIKLNDLHKKPGKVAFSLLT